MRIEVLYFDGCPNHGPAIERVRGVLNEEGISAQLSEVNVTEDTTAQEIGFLGSPSIRVNGLDVEPTARSAMEYGMMCRTYLVGDRREGLPSREMIRRAIREAGHTVSSDHDGCEHASAGRAERGAAKGPSLLMVGSVLAAIGASLCCTLPIFFALTGFSILGASAFFEPIRPYLLAATFGFLGLGFYYAYRPVRRDQCTPGSACAVPSERRGMRLALWAVTVVAVAFAAFPYYSGRVAEFLLSKGS